MFAEKTASFKRLPVHVPDAPYVCLTYERRNLKQIPLENITCSEKEKQNIQAKKVHKAMSTLNRISLKPPHIF